MCVTDSAPMQSERVQCLHSKLLRLLAEIRSEVQLEDERIRTNYMVDGLTLRAGPPIIAVPPDGSSAMIVHQTSPTSEEFIAKAVGLCKPPLSLSQVQIVCNTDDFSLTQLQEYLDTGDQEGDDLNDSTPTMGCQRKLVDALNEEVDDASGLDDTLDSICESIVSLGDNSNNMKEVAELAACNVAKTLVVKNDCADVSGATHGTDHQDLHGLAATLGYDNYYPHYYEALLLFRLLF